MPPVFQNCSISKVVRVWFGSEWRWHKCAYADGCDTITHRVGFLKSNALRHTAAIIRLTVSVIHYLCKILCIDKDAIGTKPLNNRVLIKACPLRASLAPLHYISPHTELQRSISSWQSSLFPRMRSMIRQVPFKVSVHAQCTDTRREQSGMILQSGRGVDSLPDYPL